MKAKVRLNRSESVTVLLGVNGAGQIWIRAYAGRSPGAVYNEAFHHFDRRHQLVLMDLSGLIWDPRQFRQCKSWPGLGDLAEVQYDQASIAPASPL